MRRFVGTTLIFALLLSLTGCSTWSRRYNVLEHEVLDRRVSQPHRENGQCVVTTTTEERRAYKIYHRFRWGADLIGAIGFLATGWLFIGASFLPAPEDRDPDEYKRGALTAGLVITGFSVPFWAFYLWKRIDKPPRDHNVYEEIKTTEELEAAEGCEPARM